MNHTPAGDFWCIQEHIIAFSTVTTTADVWVIRNLLAAAR
jgi:hypothetical protein